MLTTTTEIFPKKKNTSAVSKFNDEDFSFSFNQRLEGLYSQWNNLVIFGGKPESIYELPLEKAIDKYDFSYQTYAQYVPNTNVYSCFITSHWSNIYKETIPNIATAYASLNRLFGIELKTEKDYFIDTYFLKDAINAANELIISIFGDAETETKLDVDYEEPEYKFLNISIKAGNISLDEIESYLDKFDELQELYHKIIDKKYTSKITFHLDIT